MILALTLLAQVATATPVSNPTPAPVRTKDPRPIPVRRAEEMDGTYVLHYREWPQGSIMFSVLARPDRGIPGGSLSVFGSLDTGKGWRWLKDHDLSCNADGAVLRFASEHDGDVNMEGNYLTEHVTATIDATELRMIAKAEKVECFVGSTQMDTNAARRADLLKALTEQDERPKTDPPAPKR